MTTIFRRFRPLFENIRRFSKIVAKARRTFANIFQIFSDDYRRFPKITESFRGRTDDVLIIQQQYFLRDYVAIAMVILRLVETYMLFAVREARIGKNCARGLEPYSRPRAQFFPIRTDQGRPRTANNVLS